MERSDLKTIRADVGFRTKIALDLFGYRAFIDFMIWDPILIHSLWRHENVRWSLFTM